MCLIILDALLLSQLTIFYGSPPPPPPPTYILSSMYKEGKRK